ncbi:MAG TPA: cupin domain-containing protein [Anaerolineae bacterium]|nr:cupin domain-containing protein [Anaerolineae bacterium]
MYLFDLNQLAEFKETGLGVQMVAQSAHARHVLFSFKAGQGLREHQTTSQITVQVISGEVTFSAEDSTRSLTAGQMVLLAGNIPHAVEAITDSVMLLIMTPDPQAHSLGDELFEGIRPIADLS